MSRWLLCALALALPAAAQEFFALGDFSVRGGTIPNARLAYRTHGTLNADKSNAILFPTWFSGSSQDLDNWIGPGRLANTNHYFVIAVDALGNGVSSSPSNTPGKFPEIAIGDMVEAQRRLVDHLGIAKLHAVMGISMGGMQTFEWMVRFPDRMARAVPIIGSPRLTAQDLLLWQAELSALDGGAPNAMETVNAIHQFALYTPGWRRTNGGNWKELQESLGKPGRMTPADWAAQLRAMMSHNVGPVEEAASQVRARTLIVVATQDLMVNPEPARAFARRLGADVLELTGDCGHMATSCQATEFAAVVQRFLSRK